MRSVIVSAALLVSLLAMSTAHGQLFSENWDSGVIDPCSWILRDTGTVDVSLVLADPCLPGDYALKLNGPSPAWGDEIFSAASYARMEGLQITFLTWGISPSGYCSHAGFHNNNGEGGGGGDVYGSMEAAIGYVYYSLRAAGGEDGAHGLGDVIGGNEMSLNHGDTPPGGGAISDAVSKATALKFRITLGGTSGAEWAWSNDFGATWTIEHDTRNDPLASSASTVWAGFGPFGGGPQYGSYIDDIVITPEPMTMTLLGLGGLALLRRRKRA